MIHHLICSALATLSLSIPALSDGLDVRVEGIRNDKGNVLILVFDDARAFDSFDVWRAIDYAEVPARKGEITHAFPDLNAGPYAVVLFHDENGDQDLNMTATRLLEGVGSTGATNPTDEPDFKAASVWPGNIAVRIHYDK